MGNCTFCGEPAGLLRSAHPECKGRHNKAVAEISAAFARALAAPEQAEPVKSQVALLAQTGYVAASEQRALAIKAWEAGVERFLEDGQLEATEEDRLEQFHKRFDLSLDDLDRNGWRARLVKAGAIRDVLEGKIPDRFTITGNVPINPQKGEKLVWAFPNCNYYEDRTRTQYVGRSSGVSVRVMKGVYYRAGQFKGHPVEQTTRVHVDTGAVIVTDRNLYFAGPAKSMRIPYSKIVSFEPFSNGIGFMRDAANAKAQIFGISDGWFAYNLISNLAQLDANRD